MSHKFLIFTMLSAASVFTFSAAAKDTLGPGPSGSDRRGTLHQNVRAEGGMMLFEKDDKNADFAITCRIREEITLIKNLSVNARNVKIITTGGRVVLKGAVITTEEKRLIGDIAIGVQRRENVDNQLVVGLAPSAPTGLRVVQ